MAVPAAKYLICFNEPERVCIPDPEPPEAVDVCEAPEVEVEVEVDDTAERLEEAYCRGKDDGVALAQAEFENTLAEERSRFEQQMEEAKSSWAEEVADRLAEQIPAAFHEVEARIAASVARILRPALFAAVRDDVISSLMTGLPKLRSEDGSRLISISGSPAVLDKLRERAPELEASVEFLPSQNVDVKVIADQTVLDSQIQSWCSVLETRAE